MRDTPLHTNRLIHETSPYLLQHAHNPVDWYPWGEEALTRAREEDRPVLLSIGYSSCHWCHVMERESFEDEEIARLMNEHFIPVKVDREERPDLDEIYMAATVMLNRGQGGWPMTVFLTPKGKPFFAGTYFPPQSRMGRPGFRELLRRISDAWAQEREALTEQSHQLTAALAREGEPDGIASVGLDELDAAARQLAAEFDAELGGFGPPPKFPPTGAIELLLRHHQRTGDEQSLLMAEKTLTAMANGGIYDHVGGGFARYSTDAQWLVPHFEKMLYDNGLLVRSYLAAFQLTKKPRYAQVAREVLDYLLREMLSPEGVFYSATDADSEGVEGKFFVWTPAQIEEVLGEEEAAHFCDYYNIDAGGNFEGRSIPNVTQPVEHVAVRQHLTLEAFEESLAAAREKLYAARQERVPPGLDDKALTAWNALAIGAFAEASWVLGEPRYLKAAEGAARFLRERMWRDGRLLRTYRAGRAHLAAVLEDYAYLADALLDLYEAGGDSEHAQFARVLADEILVRFGDARDGSFFTTGDDHEELIVRSKSTQDGATPSPLAVSARVLVRLSSLFDQSGYRAAAEQAIKSQGRLIRRFPRAFCRALGVADLLLAGPVEVALVGRAGDPGFAALHREIGRAYLPNRIVARRDPGNDAATDMPLVADKNLVADRAALYVCRDFACQAPLTEPSGVAEALGVAAEERVERRQESLTAAAPGSATASGTARLAARFAHPEEGYATLGRSGLLVSRVGFGAYRVGDQTPGARQALRMALRQGCNVIDTSTNYTDGESEMLIGEVLAESLRAGDLLRDEVVVVSKIGYVQGKNLAMASERRAQSRGFPEMVEYMEGCWHNIHPEFLADQLARSRRRLQLAHLDVCLLHNPEYFFKHAAERGEGDLVALRDTFYRRLEAAFAFFEEQIKAGHLGWYGVSSNSAGLDRGDPEATSLSRMWEAAERAGGTGHHFTVLQLPLNLLESSPLSSANNEGGAGPGVLAAAAEVGVGVLVNRPLNAFIAGRMVRLADFADPGPPPDLEPLFAAVGQIEARLTRRLDVSFELPEGQMLRLAELFAWESHLRMMVEQLVSRAQWQQMVAAVISPRLNQTLQIMSQLPARLAPVWRQERGEYVEAVDALLDGIEHLAQLRSRQESAALGAVLRPSLPPSHQDEPLSRLAVWVTASTPGVSSVLVGMRQPAYVDDAMAVMSWPQLDNGGALYAAANEWSATQK